MHEESPFHDSKNPDNYHTVVITNRSNRVKEKPDLENNVQIPTHIFLQRLFPDCFPKVYVASRKQKEMLIGPSLDSLPKDSADSSHIEKLSQANPDNVYVVERIRDPRWEQIVSTLSFKDNVRVVINILEQVDDIFTKTGILLGDRSLTNVFVKPDLNTIQIDFGFIEDLYSEDAETVALKSPRTEPIKENIKEVNWAVITTVKDLLDILLEQAKKRKDMAGETALGEVYEYLKSIKNNNEELQPTLKETITKLKAIWNTLS